MLAAWCVPGVVCANVHAHVCTSTMTATKFAFSLVERDLCSLTRFGARFSARLCISTCADPHCGGHWLATGATNASECLPCLAGSYSSAAGPRRKISGGESLRAYVNLRVWQRSSQSHDSDGSRSGPKVQSCAVVVRWRELHRGSC